MRLFLSKGFTIVELLVVVFIITTLTSVSVIYYRQGEKQLAFQRTVSKVVQDIRRVQEMAMSGKKCPANLTCPSESRYGIHFEKNQSSYLLFIDWDGDGVFQNQTQDRLLEEINLEGGARISDIKNPQDPSASSLQRISLTFVPPDPLTIIKRNRGLDPFLSVKIEITQDNKSRLIEINKFGLIASD